MAHSEPTVAELYPRGTPDPVPATEIAFADAPANPFVGQLINFTDSNTATWGASVAAGGANHVLARWNGAAWTVVGK